MRRLLLFVLMIGVVLLLEEKAYGVSAFPGIHTLRQPDGLEFKAKLWGDEWVNGWETLEGYTILKDEESGKWVYAQLDPLTGKLIPTSLVVEKDLPLPSSFKLRPLREVIKRIRPLRLPRGRKVPPSTGTIYVPVILINFNDRSTSYSVSDFEAIMFGNYPSLAPQGSVKDYYTEVSYGNLTLAGEVTGWYLSDQGHDYYGYNQGPTRAAELVREAVEEADLAGFDFSPYDNDGDGYVDGVLVIHQGTGAEASGDYNDIWSHMWSLNGAGVGEYLTDDGVRVDIYSIQPEIFAWDGQITTIGVIAHEFGHILGLPDLYDYGYDSPGIGNWGIMSGGSWNGVSRAGDSPAHFTPWCKWMLSWLTPTQVTGSLPQEPIEAVENTPDVYQFLDNPGGPDWSFSSPGTGEYFLIENRRKTGFDQALPAEGLLIWHIDESRSNNDDQNHRLVDLESSDGNPDPGSDNGDPFPGSTNNRLFNDSTTPSSRLYDGSETGIEISNISDPAAIMTADLRIGTEIYISSLEDEGGNPLEGLPASGFITIKWVDTDQGGEEIYIYWDRDNRNYDGVLIKPASGYTNPVPESDTQNECVWDSSGLSPGLYWIYLQKSGGARSSYAGPVEIIGSKPINYPNPFRLKERGAQGIWIDNLPSDVREVRIYNLVGELVRKIKSFENSPLFSGKKACRWYGRNDRGDRVASGLYIYLVIGDSGKYRGKITFIK